MQVEGKGLNKKKDMGEQRWEELMEVVKVRELRERKREQNEGQKEVKRKKLKGGKEV